MKKNILLLFVLLFVSSCMERKYDILTAPPATGPIADYERIFTKEQRKTLSEIANRIKDRYNVNVYFLSFTSRSNLGRFSASKLTKFNFLPERENKIFNLRDEDWKTKKILIFVFSHHFRYNSVDTSLQFRKIINEKNWDERRYPYIVKYFPEHKYYEAFKAMFEITEDELERYRKENII